MITIFSEQESETPVLPSDKYSDYILVAPPPFHHHPPPFGPPLPFPHPYAHPPFPYPSFYNITVDYEDVVNYDTAVPSEQESETPVLPSDKYSDYDYTYDYAEEEPPKTEEIVEPAPAPAPAPESAPASTQGGVFSQKKKSEFEAFKQCLFHHQFCRADGRSENPGVPVVIMWA